MSDIAVQKGVRKVAWFETLYVDLDDCLLNTSEAIFKILQELFKSDGDDFCSWTIEECLANETAWDFSNFIQGRLSRDEFNELFESDLFWNTLEINEEFLELLNQYSKNYNIIFVSKGREINLRQKKEYLASLFNNGRIEFDYGFYGIKNGKSKNIVDMSDGIQIDDNFYSLEDTNAKVKILFRNKYCSNSNYNGDSLLGSDDSRLLMNLYLTEFVDQIGDILEFNYNGQSLGLDNKELYD